MRHFGVRIGEEAVRCGLVDELGSKDDGGHHARHEADGSDDDVPSDVDHYDDDGDNGCDDDGDDEDCGPNDDLQVGKVQVTSTKVASHTEEDEAKGKDEHTNSNNQVDCNHPHLSCLSSGGVVVPRETVREWMQHRGSFYEGAVNTSCGRRNNLERESACIVQLSTKIKMQVVIRFD